LTASGHDFGDIFVRDLLVGPSVVPSNGNIADGRIKWRDPVREVEEFEESMGKFG